MNTNNNWSSLAHNTLLELTVSNLQKNGFEVMVVDTNQEALEKIEELIPPDNEVLTMPSATLEQLSNNYKDLHRKIIKMEIVGKDLDKKKIECAPHIALGSVSAITETGELVVASSTGSQIPAYVYGANKVIYVVGTQKIIKDIDQAYRRIYEYILPLEEQRLKKMGNQHQSAVNKVLIMNREPLSGRSLIILVRQELGF